MKRDIEMEYMSAVAKRTRAATDRLLVAKMYGEAGVRNGKRIERIPDVELVESDEEVREEAGFKSCFGVRRGKEWVDDVPCIVLDGSPVGDGDDDGCVFVGEDGDEGVSVLRGEFCMEQETVRDREEKMVVDGDCVDRTCGRSKGFVTSQACIGDDEGVFELRNKCMLEQELIRKGKGKMVVEDDADGSGVAASKGESESVRDNDESNGRGNNRCLGRKDVGDSVGSRTEFGSTSKPYVDVEEALSFSISGNGVENENENARKNDGNGVVFSSEEETETEVSSTDSENDESDEDFDVHMADVGCGSESASGSDAEFEEEEFFAGNRAREENFEGKPDENASPCCSDDLVFLYETTSEKEILDENLTVNDSGLCVKPSSHVKESVGTETKQMEKVCLPTPCEVEILEEITPKRKFCCEESAPVVEELVMDGTKKKENDFLPSSNKEDKLDEKSSFTENGSSAKSAPTVKGFKAKMTKVEDFAWIASGENSNHLENKFSRCFRNTQDSAKNEPEVEATFARVAGTVRNVSRSKTPSQRNRSFVEPVVRTKSSMMSKINEDPFANEIYGGAGLCRDVKDNFREEASAARSVPHITSSNRSRGDSDSILTNKVSKIVPDHGEDKMRKEDNLNELIGDVAKKEEQQEDYAVLQEGKCRKPNSKKRFKTLEKINVFDVLFNSLTNKKGADHEEIPKAADVIQQDKHSESVAPQSSLPQKFTFGTDPPVQIEKTEFEQELDDLWDEFLFAIKASEIGSLVRETVKANEDTSSKIIKNYPSRCNRGEHKLTLDDEIGIRCLVCSYVQLEIKYMMPDWAKVSSRKLDRGASSDDEDPEIFDGMQFHGSKVGDSGSCSDGTVWDLIPGAKDKLYPHQQDGFEFIWLNLMGTISLEELQSSINNGMGGCIISHAPGTGKTRLTIEFLHSYLELFPDSCPLIIAPAGMLLTWEAEFKKWGVGIPFHNLNSAVLSGKEDTVSLKIFNASKQSSNTNLLRLLKLHSWTKQKSILGLSYSLFEKLAGQRFGEEKESQSSSKKTMDEQAKQFGKVILEHAGLLVLDEGHTPRNPRSRIYKALTNIQTKKRIILSGTPFQNNLAELYTILSFVRPDFAQTISPELRKFCQRRVRRVNLSSGIYGSESEVGRDDREAIHQLRCKIDPFVHVHKGSVLQESLPGLKDCVMVLNPPQYQKQIVEMIESSSYSNFEFEHILSLGTIHPSLLLQTEKDESFINKAELESRRLDPNEGVKTKFLFEMIRLSDANNEKVLVFSQYLDPLGLIKDQICSLLHWHEGKEVLQLVGKIESEQRQSIINVFNDPRSSAKVLLASTKACSEGINLVGASRVVLLDVVWNPSVERQAISRAFRLGQKKVVYSYNLIVGRMEWEKYCAQTNKDHVSNLVFCSNDEPEKRGRVLSEDKILDVLISHVSMEDVFHRIVYYPKDSLFN